MKKVRVSGFTLIELLLVVAIIAILTALVLPKLDGIQSQANHAVGAGSANDLGRYIQLFRAQKVRYPNGYDSLMTNNSTLWVASDPSTTPKTKGLHANFFPGLNPKFALSTTPLNAHSVSSLQSAGVYTVYDTPLAPSGRPGDSFSITRALAAGDQVVELTSTKIINHIYRENLRTGGTSGAIPADKRLVVFGFGPQNEMVGKSMLEVPFYPNVDPTLVYNRNLVVFEVPTASAGGRRAIFKCVLASDGDLLDDMAADLSNDAQ